MSTPMWRKSSMSTNQGGECVEVAALFQAVGVRDSKNPGRGYLVLSKPQFTGLVLQIKRTR
ncbi:uncharacterized protein DUF397 [Actinomadura pelletieri DSM 43383]|uniref:Uncharacterized protein DUF397 n=1 Tax=Actinomadura pelletieri DSM 43383 TaxID=1120940 RepID=A0A495QXH9_9ACTN|nr:DUF397 domain-containing protein [Actinomadura pelletieri]RKS78828.1 uncharacterized protein DUF397 [Actinomadura pelletieri DSM 43383]